MSYVFISPHHIASAQGWIRRVWVGRSWMELHHGNLTPAVRFSAMGTLGMGTSTEVTMAG